MSAPRRWRPESGPAQSTSTFTEPFACRYSTTIGAAALATRLTATTDEVAHTDQLSTTTVPFTLIRDPDTAPRCVELQVAVRKKVWTPVATGDR